MATFEQFRSSFPENNNEKGELFEVFLVEWMFKHHPALSSQFKRVWRFSDWPGAWSQKDLGTDLIAEDQHGKICAIQAKFYKEKNSIPKSHIDSFLSDSNRKGIDYRLLIATTDNLGPNARKTIEGQERAVQTFLLHQFLEPFEWPESIDSLERYKPRQPHQPRPHQLVAINEVCSKIQERGQLLMACGTGKTLTGQRITEALKSETTLVLLPSLLLLSKTVSDWVSEKEREFIYLPVCSDKSATKKTDEISLTNSELCFRSTTDPKEIARFLKRPERKVIFSTYQSSPQIAEAFKRVSLKPFDLIIADEAHRCAGKVSTDYSTVLSENLIPAKKRLFMTATPRIYSSRLQKNASEAEVEVASMDDEKVFGPVLHHLSFGQAIENDPPLLTDYRVVVVGVNDALVREQVEERTLVKTKSGLQDDARSLAIQVGLSKAIKEYDLRRVISFHSRVNYASDFATSFKTLQEDLKSPSKPTGKIEYGYVSGSMPTSQRSRELRALGELANEDRYIVGNARCLSEGVDVPALDGVAFVDPKRSEIDIVQAVGRAIRLAKGKSFGTIVVPVFISDTDDPDEVLSASEFDQVWKVVNALKAHDETLAEELDELRVRMGKKQKISLRKTKLIFDVPQTIGDDFIGAFETKLVETTTASWGFWYGLLEEFVTKYGHARVPTKHVMEGGHKLGVWCDTQRVKYEKGTLPSSRIVRLESFLAKGWVWSLKNSQRLQNIDLIEQFYIKNGHTLIPEREKFEAIVEGKVTQTKIGAIAKGLRQAKAAGTLEQNWVDLLERKLDFKWDLEAFWWNSDYKALRRWARRNGTASPPKKTKLDIPISKTLTRERDIALFRARCVTQYSYWVTNEGKPTAGRSVPPRKLTKKQISALERIPHWAWDAKLARWLRYYEALLIFVGREGSPHVPANKHKETMPDGEVLDLSRWLSKQRLRYKHGKLERDRIEKLNEVGFDWSGDLAPKKRKFQLDGSDMSERVDILSDYVREHGHAVVRQDVIFKGFKLGSMVSRWRQMYHGKDRRKVMSSELRESLEAVHPTWMWSAADAREGIAQPVSDTFAIQLLGQKPSHEISKVIRFGLYAGLRLFDTAEFGIQQLHGVYCFHLKERPGFRERYIPIHGDIEDLNPASLPPQTLGASYRRLPLFAKIPADSKILFNSLHMTFRSKLMALGLDSEIVNGLSGWNPRIDWTQEILREAKNAIDLVKYSTD